MGKHDMPQGGRPQHKPKKLGAGISIEKFARAKSSGYDKRAVQEKERALNAKKVNKYKKLKQRLQNKLQPPTRLAAVLDGGEGDSEEERERQLARPPKKPRGVVPAVSHAAAELAAAGDVPGSALAEGPVAAQREGPQGGIQPALQPDEGNGLAEWQHKQRGQQGKGPQRQKPTSQLQRLAVEVQAKKEAEQREREERERQAAERRAKLEEDRKRRATQNKLFRKKTHSGQPLMKYRLEKVLGKLGATGAS